MKYCPYCGADFADGAASFCMECGKSLPIAEDGQKKPKEKPVKSQKRMEKKRKHPSPNHGKNMKSLSAYAAACSFCASNELFAVWNPCSERMILLFSDPNLKELFPI